MTTTNYDVIIVGAGAAGLAAARVLQRHGKKVAIVEASSSIGGRAKTIEAWGHNCDLGAHWLHYGTRNVFLHYANALSDSNYELIQLNDDYMPFDVENVNLHSDSRVSILNQDASNFKQRLRHVENIFAGDVGFRAAGNYFSTNSQHRLLSQFYVNSVLHGYEPDLQSAKDEWDDSIGLVIGNFDMGKEWSRYSNSDYQSSPWNTEYNPDHVCKNGYGNLLKRSAIDLFDGTKVNPVKLIKQTVVKIIDVRNDQVKVITNKNEELQAESCIVTVSNGVHNSGPSSVSHIKIGGWTDRHTEIYQNVPMGHYGRVILNLGQDIFEIGEHKYAFIKINNNSNELQALTDGILFITNVFGSNIVYADVGGMLAENLVDKNIPLLENKIIQKIQVSIKKMTGKDISLNKNNIISTGWSKNPFTLGSFASANPKTDDREHLFSDEFSVINDRIFFAGEAHHKTDWATVSGAHQSGCKTAQELLEKIFRITALKDNCYTNRHLANEYDKPNDCKYLNDSI